jgi:hypothetical protein
VQVVVNSEEIMVRIETPDGVVSQQDGVGLSAANLAQLSGQVHMGAPGAAGQPSGAPMGPGVGSGAPRAKPPSAAVDLAAEISVKELLDDYNELVEELKVFLSEAPGSPGADPSSGAAEFLLSKLKEN